MKEEIHLCCHFNHGRCQGHRLKPRWRPAELTQDQIPPSLTAPPVRAPVPGYPVRTRRGSTLRGPWGGGGQRLPAAATPCGRILCLPNISASSPHACIEAYFDWDLCLPQAVSGRDAGWRRRRTAECAEWWAQDACAQRSRRPNSTGGQLRAAGISVGDRALRLVIWNHGFQNQLMLTSRDLLLLSMTTNRDFAMEGRVSADRVRKLNVGIASRCCLS